MNTNKKRIAVTGAFGYSGKYIARTLLTQGHEVITLTSKPDHLDPFNGQVAASPFNFEQPEKLVETLRGVDVLINTYWVRFDHGKNTYHQAVSNTRTLFQAAKEAGVQRVVHVSITNPSSNSPFAYFWGKALLEEDLQRSGMDYTILRPAVIFGQEDILINNIAWFLRYFPLFITPGDGEYKLQPIYVEDLAMLAAGAVMHSDNRIIDAIGPETYSFNELIKLIRSTIGSKSISFHVPPMLAQFMTQIIGKIVGDVILTKEEVRGLMADLLVTDSPPAGETRLSDWVAANAETLGKRYANEIERHFVRV